MALINCQECSREISDQITKCIHCGFEVVVPPPTPTPPTAKGCLKSIVKGIGGLFIMLVLFGVYMRLMYAGANVEMQHIENQVAVDAAQQYVIAKKGGNAMDAYIQAGVTAAAYLQAKDEVNYKKWKDIEKKEAVNAGVSLDFLK
jgi:DNA-directed RNA polymerase subunit RPC12/RpoP